MEKYGKEQVNIWRRSYDTPPPECDRDGPHNPANDPTYRLLSPEEKAKLPLTESLKVHLSVGAVMLSCLSAFVVSMICRPLWTDSFLIGKKKLFLT